jgi:hypothetical protein
MLLPPEMHQVDAVIDADPQHQRQDDHVRRVQGKSAS